MDPATSEHDNSQVLKNGSVLAREPQNSLLGTRKIENYQSRTGSALPELTHLQNSPTLIFEHPPSAFNFPDVYKDETFWEKKSAADLDQEVKTKFALGKYRQKLLVSEGLTIFDQAHSKMVKH